jgi:glycosyltransferase involved in cell wall biosynthesis
MALSQLLPKLRSVGIDGEVLSLTDENPLGERIRNNGISVEALHARRGFPDLRLIRRLRSVIREQRFDLIQTWMYHADLIGGLAAYRQDVPVIWGIHHTIARRSDLKPATYAIALVNALLSHPIPARIICCAESSRATHLALGYDQSKMVVIPNGTDTTVFQPDAVARVRVRQELGLPLHTLLVGFCGRFDAQKDHQTFIRAAGLLNSKMQGIHFVLWGSSVDPENGILRDWIASEGLSAQFHLLGLRPDSAHLMAALDISSLASSHGEAFPLVIGEAMSSGVPCTVTDVGDMAHLVGETGRVVLPRHPEALAAAWEDLLSFAPDARIRLGGLARQRIVDFFSLEVMATAYAKLYQDIISKPLAA